ncbi:LamG-like jellyroll fold domain-containing protein, partial [Streptomyces clavuligerus]|uniref:LamG-like jellyroll fold domain-containing protein n=1 Tax=Streptomyces clavuligerus TaxID=1901 RepID=UPI0018D1B17F
YVNGAYSASGELPLVAGAGELRIGADRDGAFFAGVVDEVRVWDRARAQVEIGDERAHRLIGNEPGLAAYYRLDEGSGTRVYDQTDTAAHGTVAGGARWVTSLAPVGDHPGVRRDSFTLEGREVGSGLSASLYYQQEDAVSGYGEAAKPAKRQARVLLACATRPSGDSASPAHVATVDFGVGVDGRLADLPDVVVLSEVGRPVEETADQVTAQERKVEQLVLEEKAVKDEITALGVEKAGLEAEIAQAQSDPSAANDPTKWAAWLADDYLRNFFYTTTYRSPYPSRLVRLDTPDRWHVMRVAGVAGRYGNPAVALVNLDDGSKVLDAVAEPSRGELFPALRAYTLTDPLPTSAVWYVKGDMRTSMKLQSAVNDYWMATITVLAGESNAFARRLVKVGMAPDPFIQVKQARVAAVTVLVEQRTRDLAAKRAQLVAERAELARLSGVLLGAADLVLPVPHVSLNASGLSCAGAVLKFAWTSETPFVVDSAADRVALYFRGANGQLFAAYLDTTAVRGVQQLAAGGVTALFTARDPGVDLGSGTRITVSDSSVAGAGGDRAARLCDLTITRGGETETFTGLPRRARDLAAVVNGVPDQPVQVGTVASVTDDQVQLTAASAVAIPAYSYLWIGTASHLVTRAAVAGATALRVTPAPSAGLTPGTKVTLVRYDSAGASVSRPGASLVRGSRWITVSADKAEEPVPNGTATVRVTGHGSQWRGDAPGRAFQFDGTAQRLSLPAGRLGEVSVPAGDLTAEAWVKPLLVPSSRSRIVQVRSGDTKAALALAASDALSGGMLLDGTDDAMKIDNADPSGGDLTIEFWFKRGTPRTQQETVVSCATSGLSVGFTADGKFRFILVAGTGAQTLTTTSAYTDTDWHHWAVTFDRTSKIQTVYRDGVEVARRTATAVPAAGSYLIVGRSDFGTMQFCSGRLAELRTWSTVRSGGDIGADRYRRIGSAEPGLAGSWVYEKDRLGTAFASGQLLFADRGPHTRHGGVWGDPATADSPLAKYKVVAAVGDKTRISRDSYECGDWAHLAAVHEQSWALTFDGASWAETPDADALDITGDLTIEVFAKIDAIGTRQGLISKGRLGDGTGGSVPYQLSVLASGKLEFAFEEPGPTVKRYTSTTAVTAGFRRIALVRKAGQTTQEVKGKRKFPVTNSSGTTTEQEFDVVERVDVEEWQDIRFVVDGTELAVTSPTGSALPLGLTVDPGRYTGPGPRGNDGPLEIGRVREGTTAYPFKGTVGEVRIWGKARENNQLGTALQPRDDGLIARWTFEENEGNTTADLAGGYGLKLRGARWTADPDPKASSFTLHRNGEAIPTDTPTTSPLTEWSQEQLTLGALKTSATDFGEFFHGALEEVRLWRTARTPEQLLDSLFTRLKGDKQDLIGYWPFDSASTTPTSEAVRDHSLRGNHLDLGDETNRPAIVLSTAPVSTDTAAVRSALAGVRTRFHQSATAGPAASEYADLQYTPTGEATGVLKRAYAHITNGTWHLTTGYKVGDLVSEWVSQVQFDPQLIGYIEGAPPVPSENLTGGTDPAGCAKVTFQEADEVTSALSSSSERSVDTSFSVTAANEVDQDTLLILAPLGFGVASPLFEVGLLGSLGGSLEFSNAWTSETSVSQGTSTQRDTTATLTGAWEDDTQQLNDAIGRRWVPNNHGYALVQSETADVYALRLAHTGALVAYRMMPNPDIPKDWNIISFPINPQYTKQGTLDGAVGFDDRGKVLDPAYANATGRGDHSYFKPREAYALKRRILRERQQLENYYQNVSTDTGRSDPTEGRAEKLLESFVGPVPSPDAKQPTATADSYANRNIANTYVWTADGGFFAETTSTVDVVTQTTGGSYTVSGAVTGHVEATFEVAGIGAGFQLDASIGGGTTVTRHRSRQATRSHSLDITVNPGRDLQKRDKDSKPLYDQSGKPVLTPGKVDAYRFMTFYLGQDTTNFDDFYNKVADPTWLAGSNDPAATALRQAQHSTRKPPCWRILHRVTY